VAGFVEVDFARAAFAPADFARSSLLLGGLAASESHWRRKAN